MQELITIVDETDTPIGVKPREELTPSDIYRVSSLWVFNSAGEYLLAQRSANRKQHPLAWQSSAAGTVEEGESYQDNILKEAQQEIGAIISPDNLIPLPKQLVKENYAYYVQRYLTRLDKKLEEFTIQEEEIQALQWIAATEIWRIIREDPNYFVKPFREVFGQVDQLVQSLLNEQASE